MKKRYSLSTISVFCVCVVCVLGATIGCETINAARRDPALDQLYADVLVARQQAMEINAVEYDQVLFASAEAGYEEGSSLYEQNDARATQVLDSTLQKYNKLISLFELGSLRELAELEYQRAVTKFDQSSVDIAGLSDSLLKEGLVTIERDFDSEGDDDSSETERNEEGTEEL